MPEMVEVFKTNVIDRGQAELLVELIGKTFYGYTANFDLEDCDRVLRVKSATGVVASEALIGLLKSSGFCAEVLPDEIPFGRYRVS